MVNPTQIQKHMQVVSSHNEPLGTVDHLLGSNVKLTRDAVGQHHFVPLGWIHHVDDQIHLAFTAADVTRMWAAEHFE
jgi:hypothetical protein